MQVTSRHPQYPPVEVPDDAVSWGTRVADLAARRPDRVALVFVAADGTEQWFTQADLENGARAAARAWAHEGVTEGDIVAIALANSPEHVLATLGAWKLGACVVPLRADLPEWERGRVLDVVKPRLLIADGDGWATDRRRSARRPALRDRDRAHWHRPRRAP